MSKIMNTNLILATAMHLAVASCSKNHDIFNSDYRNVNLDGSMDKIGLAFHEISKEETCNNMIPGDRIETGGIFFHDASVVDANAATAFKPKTNLTFFLHKCLQQKNRGSCGFSIESAYGARLIATTEDQKNIYLIHNANVFVHIKVDEGGKPYSFATRKVGYAFADSLSSNGIAEHNDIDLEYRRVNEKYENAKSKYKNLSIYAFSASNKNNVIAYSDNISRNLLIDVNGNLIKTQLVTSDLSNPLIKSDGKIKSHGFSYDHNSEPSYKDNPFTLSSGLKENLLSKELSLENFDIFFKRKIDESKIVDQFKIYGKINSFQCAFEEKNKISFFEIDKTYFKKIEHIGQKVDNTVLYFFGGPSGQITNEYVGPVINYLINNGYDVVTPYYGGSIGAGLYTSEKFRKDAVRSVESDARNINRFIRTNQSVDIIAYSFGAIPAINFAARYPNKVRNLILVAPYVKHRDPSEYRETPKSIAYQRTLENSWFGVEDDLTRPKFRSFLQKSYRDLEKSGVKVHFIFGDIDLVSKLDDLSAKMKATSSSITSVKADHQLATIHPDTNQKVFSILGI